MELIGDKTLSYHGDEEIEEERMSKLFFDLIAKKVSRFLMSSDKRYFAFVCEDGYKAAFNSTGDCCADSWVEHVSGLNWLIGNQINEVIVREYKSSVEPDHWGSVDVFGYTFVTDKGRFDLEFRGEHNGYYCCYVETYSTSIINEMHEVKEEF